MNTNEFEFLENQLMATSRAIAFPLTPDLASGFWRDLAAKPAQRTWLRQLWPGLAALPVIALLVVIVSAGPARDAAADLVDSINFFETDRSPADFPSEVSGKESTLDQVQTAIGFGIPQPAQPEGLKLERVLLQSYGEVQVGVLFYRNDDVSFLLFASNAFVGKGIPTDGLASVEPVDGLGKQAYWLTGRRIVQSVGRDGNLVIGSERSTDANALLWEQGNNLYRIEGDLDKDEAIAIAHSLR